MVVYLGYDLLHLERYDELLQLTSHYDRPLPKEPDLPLLAGYVYKHAGDLDQAQAAFHARAGARPQRGHRVRESRISCCMTCVSRAAAAADFEAALKLDPKEWRSPPGIGLCQPRSASAP